MAAKKKAGKATAPKAPAPSEKHVGTVEHYYPKVKAAAVKLDADLKVGDTIHIQGHSDDYTEKVTSMQLDHEPITEGHAGESIGVRVPVKVHEHSEVTKVVAKAAAKPAPKPAAKKAKPAKKPKKAKKAAKAKKAKKAKPKRAKARKAKRAKKAKPAKRAKARKSASSRRRAGKRPTRRKR